MTTDENLSRAVAAVTFWKSKVDRRFRKNAKNLATWNLWAAEDKAAHLAQALQDGTVFERNEKSCVDFELPMYKGSQSCPETDE